MVPENLLIKARQYLLDTMGADSVSCAQPKDWPEADQLPYYLQNLYLFYEVDLFGRPCLLMLNRTQEGETPAVARKHWQATSEHFRGDVIYLIEVVSSHNRKRLIEQRVPFLVPGNQLYLPMLGIDLREYFRRSIQTEMAVLSGAAQAVILREILHRDCSGLPAKELAQVLGYSPMTITRVINELTCRELAIAEKVGREKRLSFPLSKRALWEAAQPLLQSPVTKRILISLRDYNEYKAQFGGRLAGESALSNYTELADTSISHWAITAAKWSSISKNNEIRVLERKNASELIGHGRDQDEVVLEVWAYDPEVIAIDDSCVDPLSLWLSLDKSKDERIDIACESLLRNAFRE